MPVCDKCGEEIEFRYLGGGPTPIHVNGGWCRGFKLKEPMSTGGWFRSLEAFNDPNALCPVCGATVFYYQNSSGSRVFFDDLGWPWPKHPCTDNPAAQSGKVRRPVAKRRLGKLITATKTNLYKLAECSEIDGLLSVKFQNMSNHLIAYTLRFSVTELEAQGWTAGDLKDAPSFIIMRHPLHIVVEFISVRKSTIGRLVISRTLKKESG
jgi:hypothetical protein